MNFRNGKQMACAARWLLLGAVAVAAYLGVASSGRPLAGCGDGSSCGDVLTSGWSKAFGVPVAFLGLAAYVALVLLVKPVARGDRRGAALAGLSLMLLIPAVAVWFTGVQIFAIGAICPWCCLAHTLAVLGVTALFLARRSVDDLQQAVDEKRPPSPAWISAAATLAFVVFASAVAFTDAERPTAVVKGKLDHPLQSIDVGGCVPEEEGDVVHVGKALGLHGGEIAVFPEELPVLGNAKAEKLVVMLGDFTCEHCRSLHAMLEKVAEVYGDQLGVVLLPAVRGPESQHIQRVALAVHRENPDLYRALAKQLGSGELAATASTVSTEAARLVGAEKLSDAMRQHSGWIDAQIAAARAVRDANEKQGGRRTLPQLMVDDEVVFGAHPSPGYYVDLLQSRLGVKQENVVESIVGNGSGEERPVLQMASLKQSLGNVHAGDVVQLALPFENTGEGPLIFDWIKTPPGVEVSDLPSGEIEPGGKGEIALTVRVPSEGVGLLQRKVVVHSNAKLEGLALELTGVVAPHATSPTLQVNADDGEPE